MNKQKGGNACVVRNTSSWGAPAWTQITGAKDIKLNLAPSANFDASDRSTQGDSVVPTRYKVSIEFDCIWDASTGLTALRTAFLAGTGVDAAVLDAVPANTVAGGGWGVHAIWCVSGFPLEFPLKDGAKLKIKLEPHGNYGSNPPVFYTDATTTVGTPDSPVLKKQGTKASLNNSSHNPIACEDLKMSVESSYFDSSDRLILFDTTIPTRFKYMLETTILWDSDDANHLAFRTAFINQTAVTMTVLDGAYATSGSWGLYGDWAVTDFPLDAKLRDGQKYNIKFEPLSGSTNAVTTITI